MRTSPQRPLAIEGACCLPAGQTSRRRRASARIRRGITLVEAVIVAVLLAVIAAVAIPWFGSPASERLYSAAHAIASDIQYCRDLAVDNNSTYRVNFDPVMNRYEVSHQGADPRFDLLPPSDFLMTSVGATGKPVQYNAFNTRPGDRWQVKLHGVMRESQRCQPVIEFNGQGQLTDPGDAQVWLVAESDGERVYLPVEVSHANGEIRVGTLQVSIE